MFQIANRLRPKAVTPLMVLVAGLIVQVLAGASLWQHESTAPTFLNRYSSRYAFVLAAHALVLLIWLGLVLRHADTLRLLRRLPAGLRGGLLILAGLGVLAVWMTTTETVVKEYVTVLWLCIALLMVAGLSDAQVTWRWPLALGLVVLVLLPPMYIGALADRRFEPDEAAWADRSEAIFAAGGLYTRTYYWPYSPITPGYGWLHAGYGWLLHNIDIDISIGRTWQFVSYLIAFAGIGAVAARLYGAYVAVVAAAVAALSQTFIPVVEYRGNLQIPAVATFIVFAALQARHTQRRAGLWHFIAGLLAGLSLQVHASGIIFAFALSLFYLLEYLWGVYRQRRLLSLWPLVSFGAGGLVAAVVFILFNVMPVGGFSAYLAQLAGERGAFHTLLPSLQRLLSWPSMVEGALVLFGVLYIVLRRSPADRLLMGLVGCILIGAALLDTQGYLHTYNTFFIIPVGVLLVDGFRQPEQAAGRSRRSVLAVSAVMAALIVQMAGLFLWQPGIWNWFRTGQLPPFLHEEIVPVLEPYIRDDDTVVSTHQLFWGFPRINLVSHVAGGHHIHGGTAARNGPFAEEIDLWEDVQPTLIIFIEQEMHFDPGLAAYMERHNFQVCDELRFMERAVRLYRTTCAPAASGD